MDYLRQAGLKAAGRSALQDARGWFEQALEVLEALPESPSTLEQGFDIRLELRPVLFQLGEIRRVLGRLREAETLAERLNDDRRRGSVYAFRTNHHTTLGELDEALVTGTRALEIAERLGDLKLRILTTSYLEQAHYHRGEYERVVELATDNLAALPADWVYENLGATAPASVYDRHWLVMSLAAARQIRRGGRARSRGDPARRADAACVHHRSGPPCCGHAPPPQGRLDEGALTDRAGIAVDRRETSSSSFPTPSPPPPGSWHSSARRARRWTGFGKASSSSIVTRRGESSAIQLGLPLAGSRLSAARPARRGAEPGRPRGRILGVSPGYAAQALHLLGDIATHPDRFDAERGEAHYRRR